MSFFGFLLLVVLIIVYFRYRAQIETWLVANIVRVIHVVGITAILLGSLDLVGTLTDQCYRAVSPLTEMMQIHSNDDYGRGHSETNKSKYMHDFAEVVEVFGRVQLRQRFQLNVIIICFGTFLVAYSSRRERQ